MILATLATLGFAACGDDGGTAAQMDAPASANTVVAVTCPATPAATVMTVNTTDAYMPMATTGVPVDGIVKFMMGTFHDVEPNTIGTSDPGLAVGFGQTKCLQFTAAGTYSFFCGAHGFTGTITVQ